MLQNLIANLVSEIRSTNKILFPKRLLTTLQNSSVLDLNLFSFFYQVSLFYLVSTKSLTTYTS